ncbi:AraC family transcriptional regulator [Rhodoferax sp.]|uniref:AraC family transcriptional regulator n=1 Tax=Rhodoferax sp. TaxID=50421 RepID=UPI00374D0384
MPRKTPLRFTELESAKDYAPTPQRALRCRARSLPVDTHFEPHQHAWAQLAYCDRGLMQVTAIDQGQHSSYIVPPSRAVWIPANQPHAVTLLESAHLRTVYMDISATPPGWSDCRTLVVSSFLRELIHALEDTEPGPREDALILLTLDAISTADTHHLRIALPQDKRLRALCDAVLRDPARQATLAEWAADIGASERTVARLFRDELGTSYLQWRQQAVLAHALPLLARGVPVGQVAAGCGYASDSAFAAMFKSAMGQSPSQFQGMTQKFMKNKALAHVEAAQIATF